LANSSEASVSAVSPDCDTNKDRQIAGIERHVTVAKFGRDIDFRREPCVTFEPVPSNQPGVKGGATGRDRHSIDIVKIRFHFRCFDHAAGYINVLCERLADHPRLFVNFFDHKVPMLAFLDEDGRAGDFGWRASHVFALRVKKVDSRPRDDRDVTVFQVADHVGRWRKGNRVRPNVHFASAIPDRKRQSFARSNYQIFVAFKQERKCKRTFQPRQRDAYRVDWLASFLQLLVYEMSNHLGVCVRGKTHASQLELIAQFAMIFDDAVMNDCSTLNRVQIRVLFVWTAMSCPARVANAYETDERLTSKLALEVLEFPDCAPPRKESAFKRGGTG
jgi:hypothetical protein